MASSEIIVGLDIGTTKIVVMVGRMGENGKVEILGVGKADSVGVQRGMVTHILQTTESIRKAVEEAEKAADVDIRVVNVGIAGQHIRSYQHRGIHTRQNADNEISQQDIDHLIDNMQKLAMPPGEKIIHVLPQEYIVDNMVGIYNPIGMPGIRLEANFHIVTGQLSAAKNIMKSVERAGLEIDELILEPLASADAVLYDDEKEAGIALIDIGGGTTDLAIFENGIIRHTAVIPLGGNIITEDIKTGCQIIRNYAELLKIKHGSALAIDSMANKVITIPGLHGRPPKEISLHNLAGIIQARMEEILEYVDYEIKQSGCKDKLSGGIVLTGGGALLKHSKQLCEFITGLETRIGLPNHRVAGSYLDKVSSPVYSTGIGLMLKGFDSMNKNPEPVQDESTMPEKQQPKKKKADSSNKRIMDRFRDALNEFFEDGQQTL